MTQQETGSTASLRTDQAGARRRWVRRGVIAAVVGVILFYGGIGWMFSSKIYNDAFVVEAPGEPDYEIEVLAIDPNEITLSTASGNHHLDEPGIRGTRWPGGYGQYGEVIKSDETSVTREYFPIDGLPTVGELLDIDGHAYPNDPLAAHGLPFDTITYESDIGDMPAWHVPGDGRKWAVLVHGRAASLREGLRMIPVLHDAGYEILVIGYRNDVGAPADPTGEFGFGSTEWRDVEGAVGYATERGADVIVLVGFSMGGGIVASFMLNSSNSSLVDAVVLDSPMLDFGPTVDLGASNTSLPLIGLPVPQSLTNVAKLLAGWRFDIPWSDLDYLDEITDRARYNTPTLVFHGTEDETVPPSTSRRFASERTDVVRLEVFEDAGHVRSWNVDRNRYENALSEFLSEHVG